MRQQVLQCAEFVVDANADRLENPRVELVFLAARGRWRQDSDEVVSGFQWAFLARRSNAVGQFVGSVQFSVTPEDLGHFRDLRLGEPRTGRLPCFGIHAHVKRAVVPKGEPPFWGVKLM